MQLTEIRSQIRRYTHTNATNYPDVTLDSDINRSNGEIHLIILEAEGYKNIGGDFKVINFESSDGLDPQDLGYNGEFPFPTEAVALDEVHLDYGQGDGFVKAEIIDRGDLSASMFNEDDTNNEFSILSPKVFIYRDSLFIRPMNINDTVTDGIKLCIRARQDTLTSGTDSPTFEPLFHNLLPLKVSQDYSLIYPEKRNVYVDRKVMELEAQLIAFHQDRTPINKRLKILPQDRGMRTW